jgi:hypothetical protein
VKPAILDEVQMGPKTPVTEGDFFRQPLREQFNLKHPLVRLTELINWERLDTSMSEIRHGLKLRRSITARGRVWGCRLAATLTRSSTSV